jgi:hypothetical protein
MLHWFAASVNHGVRAICVLPVAMLFGKNAICGNKLGDADFLFRAAQLRLCYALATQYT